MLFLLSFSPVHYLSLSLSLEVWQPDTVVVVVVAITGLHRDLIWFYWVFTVFYCVFTRFQ